MDPAIQAFLDERKAAWLKKKLTSDADENSIPTEADQKFSLENWLPDAAKRSEQLSLSTHPSKFSHPSAKTSMILAEAPADRDGFVRTGNVAAEPDVLGNAAAMDVYKFLTLKLQDGQTILEHLKQNSRLIQQEFSLKTAPYEELAKGLLAIQKQDTHPVTHGRVKQVYFPLPNHGDYHLLSLLTPSGLVYALKERVQTLRFSEETKAAREDRKAQRHHPTGFHELYGLAMIGYGGTKPQNISVLNSQNGGKAYLLPSLPPRLEKRQVRFPTHDFFNETLWKKGFQSAFLNLHAVFEDKRNNQDIRQARNKIFLSVLDQIVEKTWALRDQKIGWTQTEAYAKLPLYQKIWLDNQYLTERQQEAEWLDTTLDAFMRWFIDGYREAVNRKGMDEILLNDDEIRELKHEVLYPHREALQ
ncbi:MAG: type I-F CRISPR-associated protein Csy1 [Candidatus Sericytochromatia bacterium]